MLQSIAFTILSVILIVVIVQIDKLKTEIERLKNILLGNFDKLNANDLKERVYLINKTLEKMEEYEKRNDRN